jgi:predicted nuclease of predicted toxin-antitoxin system
LRLLLDEMLSAGIARELRRRGHDVEAIQEHPEWRSFEDPQVIELARTERRVLVTDNLSDMRPLHYEAIAVGGPGDYGMIFIPGGRPRTRANTGQMVAALERKLESLPGESDLANAEDWL